MTVLEELQRDNAAKVAHRFFLRIGRKAREPWRDDRTPPLFGLPLILQAEGLLAKDAAPPAKQRVSADEGLEHPGLADAAYLSKCEAAIREAAREWAA